MIHQALQLILCPSISQPVWWTSLPKAANHHVWAAKIRECLVFLHDKGYVVESFLSKEPALNFSVSLQPAWSGFSRIPLWEAQRPCVKCLWHGENGSWAGWGVRLCQLTGRPCPVERRICRLCAAPTGIHTASVWPQSAGSCHCTVTPSLQGAVAPERWHVIKIMCPQVNLIQLYWRWSARAALSACS